MRAVFPLFAIFVANVASEITFAEIDKCTTIIVGKTAGTEGPMTTHTADCSDCDFRIAKVRIVYCNLSRILFLTLSMALIEYPVKMGNEY